MKNCSHKGANGKGPFVKNMKATFGTPSTLESSGRETINDALRSNSLSLILWASSTDGDEISGGGGAGDDCGGGVSGACGNDDIIGGEVENEEAICKVNDEKLLRYKQVMNPKGKTMTKMKR